MIIHVVQEGETAILIAEKYGISAERLIIENEIKLLEKPWLFYIQR
jgi:spore germination protein YaaH